MLGGVWIEDVGRQVVWCGVYMNGYVWGAEERRESGTGGKSNVQRMRRGGRESRKGGREERGKLQSWGRELVKGEGRKEEGRVTFKGWGQAQGHERSKEIERVEFEGAGRESGGGKEGRRENKEGILWSK